MNIEIMYATTCTATVYETNGSSWTYNFQFTTLKAALEWAQFQIENRPISFDIEHIYIVDDSTAELLADCTPDKSESFEDEYDDWDCDNDMGFDPYLGCYTEDC